MDTERFFLQQVANIYVDNERGNLANYCFVFPNKRSAVFFKKYLKDRLIVNDPQTSFLPSMVTISSFINQFINQNGDSIEAGRTELLFILYDIYKSLSNEEDKGFDNFRFWGEMILNDFNDIDRYLINAHDIYKNIVDYKEIQSNFLTREQVKVINQYLAKDAPLTYIEDDKLWVHYPKLGNDASPEKKYLNRCQILEELYNKFREHLKNNGLHYSGMAYRYVAESIADLDLQYDRYVFVGFNVLSSSEKKIFSFMKDNKIGDFYWDFASPSFFKGDYPKSIKQIRPDYINTNNKATLFMKDNILKYPSLYDIPISNNSPQIDVISIASSSGQAKLVNKVLKQLIASKDINNCGNAINTAIVLPDENLFIPVLHSIPSSLSSINVTMGLPMKFTPIVTLMSAIFRLHKNVKFIHGRSHFYYEYLLDIISHPFIQSLFTEQCNSLKEHIKSHNLFNIDIAELLGDPRFEQFKILFELGVNNDVNASQAFTFTKRILEWLKQELEKDNIATSLDSDIQILYINNYLEELDSIQDLSAKYQIEMKDVTFFNLLESLVNSASIPLEGKPLKGLQIMGVLETRALDFDNLIILSMNERIFPRKSYTKTYIPNRLRTALGMATINDQESMFAYYFYRMICRAKKVTLVYDSRLGGSTSGEMSRYIYQLKYIYPDGVNFSSINYCPPSNREREIEIAKDPKELNEFLKGGHRTLSASSLKTFKKCPLQFYFQNIKKLREDDKMQDYMDAITFGNIVHSVAENLYKGLGPNSYITATTLDNLKNSPRLKGLIIEAINEHYLRLKDKDLARPLVGESKIIGDVVEMIIKKMLECEKDHAPYTFVNAEESIDNIEWPITNSLTIRFKVIIDRIDKFDKDGKTFYRFIDYKTGADSTEVSSISDLFSSSDNDAIFQLLVYSEAYSFHKNAPLDIQPYIYKLRTLFSEGLGPIKRKQGQKLEPLSNYKDVHSDFWPLFTDLIKDLFDYTIPFKQAPVGSKCCSYCQFNTMCGRQIN